MSKYLLVISIYPDERQRKFETQHSPRNVSYCNHHEFTYIEIKELNDIPVICRQRAIVWYRFFYIKYWIDHGFFKDGDIVSQIDADICIANGKYPLQPSEGKSFAYAIDSCNTHCMGVFSLRVTDWSKQMLNNLLDENRWNKYKDTPFWKVFHEQASWYSLAGIKDTFQNPGQIGWSRVANLGWNSTERNDPVYSLDELNKNVEILPVEWNVTDWSGASQYFRFPTKTDKREDVIFRHFAGKGEWDISWTQIPLFK